MSPAHSITSSSPSATIFTPATKQAQALIQTSSPSSRWPKRPFPRSGWSSGRWWSSRPTMLWPPPQRASSMRPQSNRSSSARQTRIWRSWCPAAGSSVGIAGETSSSTSQACSRSIGVHPQSIPDWLALVGDSADGYPGIPGWGAKSASAVLSRYEHLESIPDDPQRWGLGSSRAARLSESLVQHREDVLLYRQLATLREDVPLQEKVSDLEWLGAHERLKELCHQLGDEQLPMRIPRWRPKR